MNPKYASDLVHFIDLMWMNESYPEEFTFTTCKDGMHTAHNASLSWRPEFDRGIRFVDEPTFGDIEYEIFGDVTIMQMTQNHILQLVEENYLEATHWLHPDVIYSPRLIVSAVEP